MSNITERRSLFLQELGLAPQWQRKIMPVVGMAGADDASSMLTTEAEPEILLVAESEPLPKPPSRIETALPTRLAPAAQEPVNKPVDAPVDAHFDISAHTPVRTSPQIPVANMNWAQLQQAVASCTACPLSRQRQQTVLGSGVTDPEWLVIGDGPSVDDEAQGAAFSGKVGVLLDNMLGSVGKSRHSNVYLSNLVKCRAQDEQGATRTPGAEEIAACRPFLQRQIALLQPRLVLSLGKAAALALREPSTGPLRGVAHRVTQTHLPLVASWHPAIVLQQPGEKRQVWADLCLAGQSMLPAGVKGSDVIDPDDIPF
jgi:uracil-DNA glycosylase